MKRSFVLKALTFLGCCFLFYANCTLGAGIEGHFEPDEKSVLVIVGTGGTFCGLKNDDGKGYKAAKVSLTEMLKESRQFVKISGRLRKGEIEVIEPLSVDSRNMSIADRITLLEGIKKQLDRKVVQAIVVVHGTDTIDISALAVDLFLSPLKPVVFTGAMLPSDDDQADGPTNLLHAIKTAEDSDTPAGALVVMNQKIAYAGLARKKSNATYLDDEIVCGRISPSPSLTTPTIKYYSRSSSIGSPDTKRHRNRLNLWQLNCLPRVQTIQWDDLEGLQDAVFYSWSNSLSLWKSRRLLSGIVLEGTGNAHLSNAVKDFLKEYVARWDRSFGLLVDPPPLIVRCSRNECDALKDDENDESCNCVAAGFFDRPKAELLLKVFLTDTETRVLDRKEKLQMLQEFFDGSWESNSSS